MYMTNRPVQPKAASSGFTLIELMVTLLIASILLTVAVAAYQSQIRKSRRTEAKTALLDIAGREEALYGTTNAYGSTPASIGYGTSTGAFTGLSVGSGYYQVTVQVTAGTATVPTQFTATATPVVGMGQDEDSSCASFSVDNKGVQSALDASGAATSNCW
ncbi:MAG TPA: type IV pilin protein [Steroidobacteraceae bacterium]|nr:type IV pilin protein [Steroidobacteraceae bacterium]